ncbi:hypothetical protein E2K80_11080 [Rhodophyticola sp. CCM32]|uniref:hypothetical protein n=1 Tax=Rhodophyticola sp. CCM32 TaxID=2916397 RepID=UPI00107FB4BD|nr:hypothetical protein [Rhodophyticola sp. CCM32]QBY01202.1 hypothetical protein E2K80_11080 [Rhodophyticola sp. CCM32]
MRRLIPLICTIGQLAFTGPAIAQNFGFGIGVSDGPVSLSLHTAAPRSNRSCEVRIVPTGGEVRLRRGMVVEHIACTDANCTDQQVIICPARRR